MIRRNASMGITMIQAEVITSTSFDSGSVRQAMEKLIRLAVKAPSGDNLQPWRFEICAAEQTIRILVDETADTSPMNAGQRMARIAIGALAENLRRIAIRSGWKSVCKYSDYGIDMAFRDWHETDPVIADPNVQRRCTNRRLYDRSEVSEALLARARSSSGPVEAGDGVRTLWITDRKGISQWSRIIGAADGIIFGTASLRRSFLENVRFDLSYDAIAEWGLGLATLESTLLELTALRQVRHIPQWLFRTTRLSRCFSAKTRALVESSSGLCIGLREVQDNVSDFSVGSAMEAAWLALTGADLAVQPMMSLAVLDNIANHSDELFASSLEAENKRLLVTAAEITPALRGKSIAFILRFGRAKPPSGQTARLIPKISSTP
jgi:hypothetical protein